MAVGGGLSGSVPTPHGPVSVAIVTKGAAAVEVSIPAGCAGGARLELSAVLTSRLGWSARPELLVNGAPAKVRFDEQRGPLADEAIPSGGRSGVWVLSLPPGAHIVTAARSTDFVATPAASEPFPPPSWPSRFVGVDTETRGDWIGRFGGAGYILYGFNSSTASVFAFPSFIASASQIEGSLNNWAAPPPDADPRALQDPSGGPTRGIGCAYASMTVGVDIFMTPAAEGTWYQVRGM